MKIRPYEVSDFAQVCALGARMHDESPEFRGFRYDPGSVMDFADLVLGTPDALHCVIAVEAGRIGGLFVGGVAPFFFGPDRYAYDISVYVEPDLRGGLTAYRLVKAFTDWARGKGAVQARYGAATGVDAESTDRFFRGIGFRRAGLLYVCPLS